MRRFLVVLLLMALAFLAGYIPMYLRSRDIRQSLQQTETQLLDTRSQLKSAEEKTKLASLQGDLGMVLIQVDQKNFGIAKDLATSFFDSLHASVAALPAGDLQQSLTDILSQREAIISDLSTLNPESARKLQDLLAQLHKTLGG